MGKKMTKKNLTQLTRRNLPNGVRISVKASQAKKGEDIVVLKLTEISSFTDFFVIMTGNSSRQNLALFDAIGQDLKKANITPLSVEGKTNAEWILMDYGSFIVHVFSKKAREYYSLDKLWGDAPKLTC